MEEIEHLINKFKEKMHTHPELSSLWVNYLLIKKSNLSFLIEQGEQTLQMFETIDDVPTHSIALLYLINKYSDTNL
jgi:hypothetical protein